MQAAPSRVRLSPPLDRRLEPRARNRHSDPVAAVGGGRTCPRPARLTKARPVGGEAIPNPIIHAAPVSPQRDDSPDPRAVPIRRGGVLRCATDAPVTLPVEGPAPPRDPRPPRERSPPSPPTMHESPASRGQRHTRSLGQTRGRPHLGDHKLVDFWAQGAMGGPGAQSEASGPAVTSRRGPHWSRGLTPRCAPCQRPTSIDNRQSTIAQTLPAVQLPGDRIRFAPGISPEILAVGCSSDSGPGNQEESKGGIGRRATRWGQIGTRKR